MAGKPSPNAPLHRRLDKFSQLLIGRDRSSAIRWGEVRIHGRDGKIRDSDTIAPGNDPNPSKDTK